MQKLHWYCFAFIGTIIQSYKSGHSSCYQGFILKDKITLLDIKEAKSWARTNEDSVLLSVSYLGYMTEEEFRKTGSVQGFV